MSSANRTCYEPSEFLVQVRVSQYSLYAVSGGAAFLFNILIVLSILKYKALRLEISYQVIGCLSFADSIFGLGHLTGGLYRLVLFKLGLAYCPIPKLWCMFTPQMFFWRMGGVVAPLMLLVVSSHRLMAVQHPFTFMTLEYVRRVQKLLRSVYVVGLLFFAANLVHPVLTSGATVSAYCSTRTVLQNDLYSFELILGGVISTLSCLVYGLVVISLRKHNAEMEEEDQLKMEMVARERRITTSLAISSALSFLLITVPMVTGFVVLFGNLKEHFPLASKFSSYASVWIQCNAIANFFVYGLRQKEMGKAIRGLLTAKQLPVNLRHWHANAW